MKDKDLVIIDNEKIFAHEGNFYCDNLDSKSIPEGLNKFRNSKKYIDVEIIASNGQVFPAHRVIVATAGQRFGQLLDKAKRKPGNSGIIQLALPQQVPSDGINRLLEYIYRDYQ